MKMAKYLVVAALAVWGMAVQASYLYWQIDQSDYSSAYSGSDVVGVGLWGYDGNGTSTYLDGTLVGEWSGFDLGDGNWDGYSFYVEVYRFDASGNREIVASSGDDMESYANLGSYIHTSLIDVPGVQIWHATPSSVPEPTSGFLMMVGLALLGLKRRKV